jgi:hypothetical protein
MHRRSGESRIAGKIRASLEKSRGALSASATPRHLEKSRARLFSARRGIADGYLEKSNITRSTHCGA